ncbi:DUF3309 domain-containing protein [Thiohalophilus sp.]
MLLTIVEPPLIVVFRNCSHSRNLAYVPNGLLGATLIIFPALMSRQEI